MSSNEMPPNNSSNKPNTEEYDALKKRVLRKLDILIVPPFILMSLVAFIDRTSVGNARIAGLQTDAHLKGTDFNVSLAVFYIPYILVDLPSNLILKRMRPNILLPLLVIAWGVVTTLGGLIQNFAGLVAIRFALGLCEGGLLPGMVLYLSMLYQRDELQLRIGYIYASASLSGAFGGLLATAILNMDGVAGLAGWRWIFIIEGITSVLIGFLCMWILPENVGVAKFLSKEERRFAHLRLLGYAHESASSSLDDVAASSDTKATSYSVSQDKEIFEWREARRGIFDVQVWLTGMAYLGLIVSLYSFSLFLPTIVVGLGFEGNKAQLLTVPPYLPALLLTVLVSCLADRLKWRGPFILICVPLTITGYVLILTAETNPARYAATFLIAAGIFPRKAPCILSILPNNSDGHYKRATATAVQIALANCGAFISTFVYTPDQAPIYKKGHSIVLGFVCLTWVLIAANVAYCVLENRARRCGKRNGNTEKYQELVTSGRTRAPLGDRSPDFQFTL